MTCSLSYTVDEIKAIVHKQIKEDKVRQLAIMNLAVESENATIAEDNLRKAYDECSDIPQEKRAPVDTYMKQESDKYYEMHYTSSFRNLSITAHRKEKVEMAEKMQVVMGYGVVDECGFELIDGMNSFGYTDRGFVHLEELGLLANSCKLRDQLIVYFDMKTQREV
ncbi:hypothetical protein Tco_1001009 [Tanacetum coccineum]